MFKFFLLTSMGMRIVKEFILLLENKKAENKQRKIPSPPPKKERLCFPLFYTAELCYVIFDTFAN